MRNRAVKMRNIFENEINNKKFAEMFREILLPFFLYFFVYFLADTLLTLLTIRVSDASVNNGGSLAAFLLKYDATVHGIIGGLAMLIGMLPLFSMFQREVTTDSRRGNGKRTGGAILITLVLAMASSLAVNILFISLHLTESSESYSQTADNQYSVIFPIGLFLYGVISPLAEEIVFRGIIYNRMKKYFRLPLFSIILSALLFGFYHGNSVQAAYGFVMGMMIAYIYEVFGNFFFAFLFHAAANVVVYTVTGSQALYEKIITPYGGVALFYISIVLLWVIRKWKKIK